VNFSAKVIKNYERIDKNHTKMTVLTKNGRKKKKNDIFFDN
jgi:hypothetical protein